MGCIVASCSEDSKKNLENSSRGASESVDKAAKKIEEEKKKLVNTLENEIETLDKKLNTIRDTADDESKILEKKIERQKAKLHDEVTDVKNATQQNWEVIKKDASLVIENVKKELKEVFSKEG